MKLWFYLKIPENLIAYKFFLIDFKKYFFDITFDGWIIEIDQQICNSWHFPNFERFLFLKLWFYLKISQNMQLKALCCCNIFSRYIEKNLYHIIQFNHELKSWGLIKICVSFL